MKGTIFVCLLVIISSNIQLYSCCYNGSIYVSPSQQGSVNLGERGWFDCEGYGSYLYWFIDGINVENMTNEEVTMRGVQLNGSFNRYPNDYQHGCEPHYSTLSMIGSCQNNNSEVYCVVLGRLPPSMGGGSTSSSPASLIIKDEPNYIDSFNVVQTDLESVLVYWDLTCNITSSNNNNAVMTSINGNFTKREINKQFYSYKIMDPDPCLVYNFTLYVETGICSQSKTITKYITDFPQRIQITQITTHKSVFLIRFKVDSPMCLGSLPSMIRLVLLDEDSNTALQASDNIHWDSLSLGKEEVGGYLVEWSNVNVRENGHYQLVIVSQSTYGQAVSDPFPIDTYDVIGANFTLLSNRSGRPAEVCITCEFTTYSHAMGCIVILLNTNTSKLQNSMSTLNVTMNSGGGDCVSVSEAGRYSMMVHDWEGNGDISDQPAVKMMVDITKSAPSPDPIQKEPRLLINTTYNPRSSSVISTGSSVSLECYNVTETTVVLTQDAAKYDLVMLTLGVLFGSSVLVMLILVIIIGVAILAVKKKSLTQRIAVRPVENGSYVNSIGNEPECRQQKTQF